LLHLDGLGLDAVQFRRGVVHIVACALPGAQARLDRCQAVSDQPQLGINQPAPIQCQQRVEEACDNEHT
jgi:hypothetical protein